MIPPRPADRIREIQQHLEAARLTEAQIADPTFDFTACFASREWLKDHHVDVERAFLDLLAALARVEGELASLQKLKAEVWQNPAVWMRWCDHQILERAEKAEAQAQRQAAQIAQVQTLIEQWRATASWEYYEMRDAQSSGARDQCANELAAALASGDAP